MKNKVLSIITAFVMFWFIISASIALPIYIRPFYYAHVEPYRLEEISGKSREEIVSSYDALLDYLTGDAPYSTGVFKSSSEGQSHFEDCKKLFMLDRNILIVSVVALVGLFIYLKVSKTEKLRLKGFPPCFWAGVITLGAILAVVGLAATDFDRAFTIFHTIFFPGKDNWMFYPQYDEIIRVLPQDFFMNCGILIAVGIILLCAAFIIAGVIIKRKESKKESL